MVERFLHQNEMVGESKIYEWTIDWLSGRAYWQVDHLKIDEPNYFLFKKYLNSVGNQPHCCRTRSIDNDNCDLYWCIRDMAININEFTSLCTNLIRNELGIPYKVTNSKLWIIRLTFLTLRKTRNRFTLFISSYVFSSLNTL